MLIGAGTRRNPWITPRRFSTFVSATLKGKNHCENVNSSFLDEADVIF